jgi:hypothetical protein
VNPQPLISIITVNYNGLKYTEELLNSIQKQSYKNIEIWVVDNASKENPVPYFNENYPEIKTIHSEKNRGFAGGNNLAIKEAKGDFLFFINNDAEITEGVLEKLVALFYNNTKLGMASPMICYYKAPPSVEQDFIQYAGMTEVHPVTARNTILSERTYDEGQHKLPFTTAYAHGAAMMIKREVIEKVGLMYENYFLYYEELDWSARIRRLGYEIMVEPRAKVYHKESVSVGTISPLKTYYLNRNRILFMRRNVTNILPFLIYLTTIVIPKNLIFFILKGQIAHARVFIKAIWWHVKNWRLSYDSF